MVSSIDSTRVTSSFDRNSVMAIFHAGKPVNRSEQLYAFGEFAPEIPVEKLGTHAALDAISGYHCFPVLFDLRIFHPVGDRRAAFGDVHAGIVNVSLAGW